MSTIGQKFIEECIKHFEYHSRYRSHRKETIANFKIFLEKAPGFNFEDLLYIWKFSFTCLDSESIKRGDYFRLKAWALDRLFLEADKDISQLLRITDMTYGDSNRVPITQRVAALLLEQFSEEEQLLFQQKKYGTYEITMVARSRLKT